MRTLLRSLPLLLAACAARPAANVEPAPATPAAAVHPAPPAKGARVRALYDKREVLIPMRDGVRLFTSIYAPKDAARPFPILLRRTPYSCRPYGADAFPDTPGPSDLFTGAGYAFAVQDVRGTYMSEGDFVDVRPEGSGARAPGAVDESTDTWDTVEWLVRNVAGNNGRVGMWGISYPGFYAAAGMIDAHPALRAVSPQAPIADWWWDDFRHNGALFLPHAFLFLNGFGRPRPAPVKERPWGFDAGTPDGWDFFLRGGSPRALGRRYFGGDVRFWDELLDHGTYDAWWRARDLLPRLQNVAPAVMAVGGWYDAEDLYGPLAIHRAVEAQNPGVFNVLVMGPWVHGGWARTDGDALGQARFGAQTSAYYQAQVEKPFFDRYLLDGPDPDLPEALAFDTGTNAWRRFDAWPPEPADARWLSLAAGGRLELVDHDTLTAAGERVEFVSDPMKPVPHTAAIELGMNREYMVEDQRFAARRPDVLTFTSEPLAEDLTLAGPLRARLLVTTDGTDADWIVKLVDVYPGDAPDPRDPPLAAGQRMGNWHRLVRGDVMPGRFREGYDRAVPFEPGVPAEVAFTLWDVLHTFRAGHRVQVQVQSTWFPLVARNPQTFLADPYDARPEDYRRSVHAVLTGSCIQVGVLPR